MLCIKAIMNNNNNNNNKNKNVYVGHPVATVKKECRQ
jgi:hypothetical protein